MKTNRIVHFPKLQKRKWLIHFLKNVTAISNPDWTDSTSFSDFRCSDKQFRCKNGECVKKHLFCDGDFACKDESDEDDCECPSNRFRCQREACLLTTAVCDGKNDCSNGDDEHNCRKYTVFNKGLRFGVQKRAMRLIFPLCSYNEGLG